MSAAMGESECNDIQLLLPAYALGALEPEEQSRVDDHLATCQTCRAEAASYAHVVDSLGVAAPHESPPPALKAQVLAAATGQTIPAREVVAADTGKDSAAISGSTWRSNRVVYMLSAAAILFFVGFVVLALVLERTIDDRDDAVAAQEQLASYFGAGGQVEAMISLDAANWGSWQGEGKLLSAPGKPTMVVVDGCPPTSAERVYRVWVALKGDRTGVGEIKVDDNGTGWMEIHAPAALSTYDELGITVITNGDNREDMMVTEV
jgi:anti-sigma-K factor RskA